MTDNLKACPLCGSSCFALVVEGQELGSCSNEGCVLWSNMRPIKEWQTRPIEDELRAEIERLKDTLLLIETAYHPWDAHKTIPVSELRRICDIARAAREPKGGGS